MLLISLVYFRNGNTLFVMVKKRELKFGTRGLFNSKISIKIDLTPVMLQNVCSLNTPYWIGKTLNGRTNLGKFNVRDSA